MAAIFRRAPCMRSPPRRRAAARVVARAKAVLTLLAGTVAALWLIGRNRPAAVVGFGGYPSVPPVFAATLLRVPTILHEQNAVMGRANRFLAARVDAVAQGFPTLKGLGSGIKAQTYHTGNPVRPSVLAAATVPYPCRMTARSICSSPAARRARG